MYAYAFVLMLESAQNQALFQITWFTIYIPVEYIPLKFELHVMFSWNIGNIRDPFTSDK